MNTMEVTIELVGKKQQWIFSKPEIRLGREVNNDVRLSGSEFEMVSRSHAILRVEGDACYVEDASSPNGTFVNGKQVQRVKLFPADVVRLGADGPELKVRFVSHAGGNEPTIAGPGGPKQHAHAIPTIGKPAPAAPAPEAGAGAEMIMLEQKLDGLKKMLSVTLAVVVILAGIVVYQGYMISHTQDTVVQMRRQATDAVAQFTPALNEKLAEFQKRSDDMQSVVNGFDARVKASEDEFVNRMNRELPATLDRYIEHKVNEVRGGKGLQK